MGEFLSRMDDGSIIMWPAGAMERYGIDAKTLRAWEQSGKMPPRDARIGWGTGWRIETIAEAERQPPIPLLRGIERPQPRLVPVPDPDLDPRVREWQRFLVRLLVRHTINEITGEEPHDIPESRHSPFLPDSEASSKVIERRRRKLERWKP